MDIDKLLDDTLKHYQNHLPTLTKADFARMKGVGERTVGRYLNECDPPLPAKGSGKKGQPIEIHPLDAIKWELSRELKKALPSNSDGLAEDDDGQVIDIEREKALYLRAERRHMEEKHLTLKLERRQKEKDLVELEQVKQLFSTAFSVLSENLKQIGSSLVNEILETRDVSLGLDRFDIEMNRVLTESAEQISEIESLE